MTTTAANTRVAVTGGAFMAPVGTTLPTDAGTALDPAFNELGFIDEEGVTQSIDESTERIRAWQNRAVVRLIQTDHDVQYALSLLEINEHTLEAYFGNFDPKLGGGEETVEIKAGDGVKRAWVFNIVDGGTAGRLVIPEGQVVERGDVEYVSDDAIKLPITIEAIEDASGVKAYQYGLIPA